MIRARCERCDSNLVTVSWVCAMLDEGGLWHHRRGITSREASVTMRKPGRGLGGPPQARIPGIAMRLQPPTCVRMRGRWCGGPWLGGLEMRSRERVVSAEDVLSRIDA